MAVPVESIPSVDSSPRDGLTMPVRPLATLAKRMSHGTAPRRTVRLRLTVLYGGLFLVSGAGLLSVIYLLVAGFGLPHGIQLFPTPPRGSGDSSISGRAGFSYFSPGQVSALRALEAQQHTAQLHDLLALSGIALLIMAVVSIWLGWFMAGRVLRPLRVITATTRQISEDNLHQRLALQGPRDELKELGDTIDGLLGRLEGAFEAQQSFVANASHELRTPLAMMRTSLDVAAAKSPPVSGDTSVLARKVREGLDQADRLIESFLVLASAQRGVTTDLTTVSLSEIASRALATRATALADRGLSVQQTTTAEVDVIGSATLLRAWWPTSSTTR